MQKTIFVKWRIALRVFFIIFIGCVIVLIFLKVKSSEKVDEKIDWNDYEMIRLDSLRTGFGEHGEGETLKDPKEIEANYDLFNTYGMSVLISDKISLSRSIPDFRHRDCLRRKYFSRLPRVSIIIIFNNEVFSVFKRTLVSLYNRTPHELVEEVILVNDNSTLAHLYDPLRMFVVENFPDFKFKIINLNKRHGLMKARVIGAKAASSEIIFMMEPHCEMTYNWLPPLIEPLLEDHRVVTVPIIDNIEWQEMKYYENDLGNLGSRGIFDWKLGYQKLSRFSIEDEKKLDPFPTPIMTGGIFMIRKDYFLELGPYDEGLLIWGAENLELSFKINLCGGRLLEVPCSRIGHVFRAFTKWRQHESGIDFVSFNRKRIVEVWFDEYKEFVYKQANGKLNIDVGDLQKQKAFRKKLKCKPMKYFFDVVAPDLLKKFPYETPLFAEGNIQLDENNCLKVARGEPGSPIVLEECKEAMDPLQVFELTWFREIRLKDSDLCLDFYKASINLCKLILNI